MPNLNDITTSEFLEGYQAYQDHKELSDNPYDILGDEAEYEKCMYWITGFVDALCIENSK